MAVVDLAFVPEEIIMKEILTRLPVKSLVRFRCVCKSWNSQFYNPNFLFCLNHHHRSSSVSVNPPERDDDDDDYLLIMKHYNTIRRRKDIFWGPSILSCKNLSETCLRHNYVPCPLSISIHYIQLVGSINGLVCMAYKFGRNHQFVLWNPIIRFYKEISMVGIDINPFDCLAYGFAWDSMTNDYKLIAKPYQLLYKCRMGVLSAAVYSCKTDCWSNINYSDNSRLGGRKEHPAVIVNGSPYWYNILDSNILKFDTPNNEFTCLMSAPSHSDCSRGIHTNLINLNDCLAFIEYNSCRGAAIVYRYDEQHNMWMQMYTFDKYMNHDDITVHCFKYGGEIVFHGKKHRYLHDPNESREIKSRLRRCHSCGVCLVNSRKRKRRGYHRKRRDPLDDDGKGHVINGFSYTPSLLALPGMKALHM